MQTRQVGNIFTCQEYVLTWFLTFPELLKASYCAQINCTCSLLTFIYMVYFSRLHKIL